MSTTRIGKSKRTAPKRHPRTRQGFSAIALMLVALTVTGCSILGGKQEAVTIYAPDPHVPADPSWPQATWQLSLAPISAARFVDSYRIAVRPTAGELEVYKGARWFKAPSEQLGDTVLHALEDSGRINAVGRQTSGIAARYRLVMDLRQFDSDYGGNAMPSATIVVNAKLMRTIDQQVVATHTFRQSVPANGIGTEQVAKAFGQALGAISHEITGWTLVSGNAHESQTKQPATR